MPMPSHEQVRQIGDVQTTYKFNLKMVTPPKTGTAGVTSDDLNLRCKSMPAPEKDIEPIKVTLHGFDIHQSGRGVYQDSIDIVFVETVNNKIKKFFRAWREACNKVISGAGNLKTQTEAKFKLEMLGTLNEPIWECELTGCLYRGGNIGTFDGASNDALELTLKLGFDYFDDKALV